MLQKKTIINSVVGIMYFPLANKIEAECWRIAQRIDEIMEIDMRVEVTDTTVPPQRNAHARWRCQVDASWINERDIPGLGFVLMDGDFPMLFGARADIHAPNHHCKRKLKVWYGQCK